MKSSLLPSNWELVPLLKVATLQRGFDLPVQNRIAGTVPIFAANGPVGSHNVSKVSGPGVVTGRSGTIGKVHFVETDYWPLNTSLFVTDFHGNDPKFVFRLLSSMGLDKYHEGTGVPTLNRNNIHAVMVPLPPLVEQKRIAGILDEADGLRRKRQQALALTDQFLRSTFLDLFGDPVTNDKKLPVKKMIELVDPARPISYGILKPGPEIPNGVPFVRVTDIHDGSVLVHQLHRTTPEIAQQYRRSQIQPGDLLLSIRGHVGRMGIVPEGLSGANITQDTARLAIRDPHLTTYIFWCLNSAPMQRWMARHVKGVAVQGINLGDVKQIPIPIPDKNRLAKLHAMYDRFRAFRSRNLEHAMLSDNLFNSLVQRAFRGEL